MKTNAGRLVLVLFIVLTAGPLFLWARTVGGLGLAALAAAAGAITSSVVVGMVLEGVLLGERRRLFTAAAAGRPVFRDGGEAVASGPIDLVPGAESCESPFGGRSCVLYSYSAVSYHSRRSRGVYGGLAQAPCEVWTPQGAVRLLGVPKLELPETRLREPEHYERARAYVAGTHFEELAFFDIPRIYRAGRELLAERESIRVDARDPLFVSPPDVQSLSLHEQVLPAGEIVTVLGIYSAARNGLVPKKDDPSFLSLNPGHAGPLARRAALAQSARFLGAPVVLVLTYGAIALAVLILSSS